MSMGDPTCPNCGAYMLGLHKPTCGIYGPSQLASWTASQDMTMTEADVRRIVLDELIKRGILIDKSDDI